MDEPSHSRPPRVLIVSYWFPPFDTIASMRMGKLAKHLIALGWDVRVLAAGETASKTQPLEVDRNRIVYTSWIDVDRTLERMLARVRGEAKPAEDSPPGHAPRNEPAGSKPSLLRRTARRIFQEIVRWPDNRAGWLAPANEAGDKLIAAWRPDVLYATSPPATSLIAADRLARTHRLPWVAEFRDLWSDHPYYEYSALRRSLERIWDQRVLTRAAAIVTVSPTWRPHLERRYGRPTIVAMNGFVAADFPEAAPVPPETTGPLRIVYTGHIYRGHRDPTPLFNALRQIGAKPSDVVVEFIGSANEGLRDLAAELGVAELVQLRENLPYLHSLEIQLRADVLLHLQWCNPKEQGTIAGKLFDYLYTRRPILGIALEDSVVAKMIHERNAGLVTNDTSKIADQVRRWIREKAAGGGIAPLPASASQGLERALQFDKIDALLRSIVDQDATAKPPR